MQAAHFAAYEAGLRLSSRGNHGSRLSHRFNLHLRAYVSGQLHSVLGRIYATQLSRLNTAPGRSGASPQEQQAASGQECQRRWFRHRSKRAAANGNRVICHDGQMVGCGR
jgi:hypothetical protein